MEIPESRVDQILKWLLYPSAFSAALEEREAATGEKPWPLWRVMLGFAIVGAACYGFTLGLLIPAWPLAGSALILPLAWTAGWAAFLQLALRRKAGPPLWLRFHHALTAMAFGELVFEAGILFNLFFWWTEWLSPVQARGLALAWLVLASSTMLTVLLGAWRGRGEPVGGVAFLWLTAFQGAAVLVFLALGPPLGIRL